MVSSPAAMNEVVVELGVLGSRLRTGPVGGHVLSFFVITSLHCSSLADAGTTLVGVRCGEDRGCSIRQMEPRSVDSSARECPICGVVCCAVAGISGALAGDARAPIKFATSPVRPV